MRERGIYTGAIALMAVVVISAIAFSAAAEVEAQGQMDKSKAIVEVKREWENARHLLDKSASDALADASFVESPWECGYDQTRAETTLASYFSQVESDAFSPVCTYSIDQVDEATGNVAITVTITCEKDLDGMLASYSKKAGFEKSVSTATDTCPDGTTQQCTVEVEDRQSGVKEVEQDNCPV